MMITENLQHSSSFGENFVWGVSTAAYQIEGAYRTDGKGESIWDKFSNTKNKIKGGHNGNIACDFYQRYQHDLSLMRSMNIKNYRFSLAWSRIFPYGTGQINPKGADYYDKMIDYMLEMGITPWVTLYHWDLPQALEDKGGWTNRDVIHWFEEYATFCLKKYGDRVKNWMVLNEPMVFTGAGYFLGIHAPGRKWLKNFLPAAHHATLTQAVGGRLVRNEVPDAQVGTTFSCSWVEPFNPNSPRDIAAAQRIDALLNRFYIEPSFGLGYPTADLKNIAPIEKYFKPNDEQLMVFDFDFIGIQNYTRELVKYSLLTPYVTASLVPAANRNVPFTLMNWEVYPECIYNVLKKYSQYPQIKKIYVTENGAAFNDYVTPLGEVNDIRRTEYLKEHIAQIFRAKQDGVNVQGYFVWTFMDNFEWAEGFQPRFGLVHVDFDTLQRTVKDSGKWYADFLSK
jgi:beta-glucosidase